MEKKEITGGSVRELWRVTFPLMISALSMFVMLFVDRVFLAKYSTAALNASAATGTMCWSLIIGFSTIAMMAEIFVAQYNGAKRYKELGEPVWQMVWFSTLSILIFLPLGFFGANHMFPNAPADAEMARWLFFISPTFVFLQAFSAFFIGQGKTSLVRWLALAGNAINALLDPLFIFGWDGVIPSMGIRGACIATGIGALFQAAIFAALFLKKSNRDAFGTNRWRFQPRKFFACIRVGIPPALSNLFEILGWAAFYWMMRQVSELHIVTTSIVQSVLLLFLFFGFGMEKGVATIVGNLIGAGRISDVRRALFSGGKLLLLFGSVTLLCFVAFPDTILRPFLSNPDFLEGGLASMTIGAEVQHLTKIGLLFLSAYIILENARWIYSGALTAAGDTVYLMIASAASIWLFMLLPTYFFVVVPKADVTWAFAIWVAYALLAFFTVYFRYAQGKWKERNLLAEMDGKPEDSPAIEIAEKP